MKIINEISYMMRKVMGIDFKIVTIMSLLIVATHNKYITFLLLGFLLGKINFYVNTYITCYVFYKICANAKLILVLSYFFRIIFISVVGLIIFVHDNFSVLPYILGYTVNAISLLIYGLKNNLNGK